MARWTPVLLCLLLMLPARTEDAPAPAPAATPKTHANVNPSGPSADMDKVMKLGDEINDALNHGQLTMGGTGGGGSTPTDNSGMIWFMLIFAFGVIGMAFFVYGKKETRAGILLAGVALMIFPYFVHNLWATLGIGLALCSTPLVIRKYGLDL